MQKKENPKLYQRDDPPPGFKTHAGATLAGCKCVMFGKGNPHWPCPIHTMPANFTLH